MDLMHSHVQPTTNILGTWDFVLVRYWQYRREKDILWRISMLSQWVSGLQLQAYLRGLPACSAAAKLDLERKPA